MSMDEFDRHGIAMVARYIVNMAATEIPHDVILNDVRGAVIAALTAIRYNAAALTQFYDDISAAQLYKLFDPLMDQLINDHIQHERKVGD